MVKRGLSVVGCHRVLLVRQDVVRLYPEKVCEPYWEEMVEYLTSEESLVLYVRGKNAISKVLKIKGKYGVGGLRDKYNVSKVHNVMHSPENKEENKVGLRVLRG